MSRIANQRHNIGEASFFKKLENTINKKNEVSKKVVGRKKSKKKSAEINEMLNENFKNVTVLNVLDIIYFTLVEIHESISRNLNSHTTQTLN